MKQKLKKSLSIILAALMLICSVPLAGLTDIDLPDLGTLFAPKAEAAETITEGYYTYTVENGDATIINVDTSINGDIVIPSTLGGHTVKYIGNYAFSDCSSLTSVIITNNIISVGNNAFQDCSYLKKVTIGDCVKRIGDFVFVFCYNLKNIELGNSITSIGYHVFQDCYNPLTYNQSEFHP